MSLFRVLHTSDWHLGHQLYKKKRDEEYLAFKNWLEKTIREYNIDALVIAGDVFDSSIPGPTIQKLYYDFLLGAARAGARHIVVTAGNHDSPALLSVASPLLARLKIHVVGAISQNPANEIRILRDEKGQAEMIVCAVPYIRERDARESVAGESIEEKEKNLLAGIRNYYARIGEIAQNIASEQGEPIPVIATGHLFVAKATPAEEERSLYVGSLGQVPTEIFPTAFDYVALGHIHRPQIAGGNPSIRYSGSPLPLSFAEAKYAKEVTLIEFAGKKAAITPIPVPAFRRLESVRGDTPAIMAALRSIRSEIAPDSAPIWIEVQHNGADDPALLPDLARECIGDSPLKLLCIKTDYKRERLGNDFQATPLEEISPEDIFRLRLETDKLTDNEKSELLEIFQELLKEATDENIKGQFHQS